MTLDEFNQLINELSANCNISESDILDSVADSARLKFGKVTSADERNLIDQIKERLILGYYQMPNHSYVTSRPDYKAKFGFDDFDMKFISNAAEELENEKLIAGNDNYIALTEKGIIQAKRLKGQL